MAIEGIDSLIGVRHPHRRGKGGRDKASDFPLFYRTRESMVIDEAIYSAQQSSSVASFTNNKQLTKEEVEAIREVVSDVDCLVKKLMADAFQEHHFTLGVLNCFLIAYVFFAQKQHFWVLYLVEMIFLIPLNQYHRCHAKPLNKCFYYFDFCWVANVIAVFSLVALVIHSIIVKFFGEEAILLSDSVRKHLFMAVLGTSCGPLLAATAVLPYIALLFHDVDTMTGLFIHIFPPMEAYCLRWHSDDIRRAWPSFFHLNYLDEVHFLPLEITTYAKIKHLWGSVAGNALILYFLWFILYLVWMLYIGLDLPRKDKTNGRTAIVPKYDTCFHAFMRGGACLALGQALWCRPRGVSLKQIDNNHFEARDVLVHMIYHASCSLASIFILGYACYSSKMVHRAALVAVLAIAVQRGAKRYSYYSISLYSRTFAKHFNTLSPLSLVHETKEDVPSAKTSSVSAPAPGGRLGANETVGSSGFGMAEGPDNYGAVDDSDELDCLDYLFKWQVTTLRTRIGLVPNYFITRGEAIPSKDAWTAEGICRRTFSHFLKLFQPTDFRDVDSHRDFVDTVVKLGSFAECGVNSLSSRAESILNQPLDRRGNTALHLLVKKRQLKFIKPLLVNCGASLKINKCNSCGQTALDFAFDRLEVEMVFLLQLFSAAAPNMHVRNSLGYAEWVFVDLIANLDTGRTLNRKNIRAIMQHVFDSDLPVKELLHWAKGCNNAPELNDTMISSLGRLPQMYALTLADGCDAITNHEAWATLIRVLFTLHLNFHSYSDAHNLVEDEPGTIPYVDALPTPRPCADLHAFLEEHDIDLTSQRAAGRTLFFSTCSGKAEYALKLSKTFEESKDPHPLAKEAAMDASRHH